MEIRRFSEQVLFGTRLEDKLLRPATLEDTDPGPGVAAVEKPGRPPGLAIAQGGNASPFPAVHELDQAQAQGRAFHFFANHELLAIELMALALLRFPDAPAGFRRGLAAIIQEEQTHLQLYVDQAQALGVPLGSVPLNGFFWRALAPIDRPDQAVAGLGLTLEQANLDYAAFYARAFHRVGATAQAQIMERVLEDEIGHVAHGVRWLQTWMDDGEDLFEAHANRLRIPLSLGRARGIGFETEARSRAGLPPDYIERLRNFRGSTGRPPVLHLFNPHCEEEMRTGAPVATGGPLADLSLDLATLPAFVAAPEDVVLVDTPPDPAFIVSLESVGFTCPRFEVGIPTAETDPHFGDVRPWGWSPVAHARLEPAFERLVARPRFFESRQQSEVHRKSSALPILRNVLANSGGPEAGWLCGPDVVGEVTDDPARALELARRWHQAGHDMTVVKADFGTSGRNAIRIRGGALESGQAAWLERAVADHGRVVVEPWLARICDLSVQLQIDRPGSPRHQHLGRFLTDARGQYLGSMTGALAPSLPETLKRWSTGDGRDPGRLERVFTRVANHVSQALEPGGYVGPVGVDALVYRDPAGLPRLKPVVEINPRTTMGHVATALGSRAPGRAGLWAILALRELERLGFATARAFRSSLLRDHPVVMRGEGIDQGALFTTDPGAARAFVSVLFVARNQRSLAAMLPAGSALAKAVGQAH